MSGPWSVILAVVAMTAIVYLFARAIVAARKTEIVHCDERGEDFTVTFDCRLGASWEPERKVQVVSCSAFSDPDHPTCDRRCLAAAS